MSSVDRLLVNYLKKRGFSVVGDFPPSERRQSPGLSEDPFPVSEYSFDALSSAHSSVLNTLLKYDQKENSPSAYDVSYGQLQQFVLGSLEVYQAELQGILWPIFIHSFFQLVQRGFPADAFAFFSKHRHAHTAQHQVELQAFAAISSPEALAMELVRQALTRKIEAVLSAFSYELLISFLEENSLFLIAKLLNSHVQIRIIARRPVKSEFSESPRVENLNGSNILWGMMPQVAELHEKAQEMLKKRAEGASPAEEGKIRLAQQILQQSIELPKMSDTEKLAFVQDLQNRAALSASQLPSVALFSVDQEVSAIAVSPDAGAFAASGSSITQGDSMIRLWQLKDRPVEGVAPLHLIGHSAPVLSLAFSPDSDFLLSASADSSIRLWSAQSGQNLVNYSGHIFPVWSVEFSPLGFYFASGSADCTARLWSSDRISPLRIFAGHLEDVNAVHFHPNCNYLASSSLDGTVRLWDIQSGECGRILRGFHKGPVRAFAFHPEGRSLASVDDQGKIGIWDLQTARIIAEAQHGAEGTEKIPGAGSVVSIDYSADGEILTTSGLDGRIAFFAPKAAKSSGLFSKHAEKLEILKAIQTDKTALKYGKFTRRNLFIAAGREKN